MPARLGQHFLTNLQIVDRIVAAADVEPGEEVVEIGPGKGILTRGLLKAGGRVTAVELDGRLCDALERGSADLIGSSFGRLRLVRADFLELDAASLPSPAAFVSNLPYAVASPILQRILSWPGWTRAVLMFQKEVAERILANPGGRKYGVLTLSVALRARVEPICLVPRTFFSPRPAVDSFVVRFKPLANPPLPSGLSEERFMSVVRAAFQHRRKVISNSISQALKMPRLKVEAALEQSGIPVKARAEEISLDSFASLAGKLV